MPEVDRRIIIVGLVLILLSFAGGLKYGDYRSQQENKKQLLLQAAEQPQAAPAARSEPKTIQVYVSGAVKNPGVYTLKEGDRVYKSVEMAGGALPEAELKNCNMAALLQDGQQLVIPLPGENPVPSNNPGTVSPTVSAAGGKININTAAAAELDSLEGIGPALAQRIVEYRQAHGAFIKIDDLKKVSGIGDKKFQAIKDRICVN